MWVLDLAGPAELGLACAGWFRSISGARGHLNYWIASVWSRRRQVRARRGAGAVVGAGAVRARLLARRGAGAVAGAAAGARPSWCRRKRTTAAQGRPPRSLLVPAQAHDRSTRPPSSFPLGVGASARPQHVSAGRAQRFVVQVGWFAAHCAPALGRWGCGEDHVGAVLAELFAVSV